MIVECKNCKGKGHVLDPCILLLPIFGWLDAAFGTNNPNALSREKCSACNGKGYISVRF